MIFRDPALQERYDADGYVVVSLLEREHVERLQALYGQTVGGQAKRDLYESSRWNDLEKNAAINLAIRGVLDTPVARFCEDCDFFGGTFMVKVREASTVLALHQDWSIVDEDRHWTAFIWCPLVDTGPANGGLFVLPGSHRWFSNYRSGSMPSLRIVPQGRIKERVRDVPLRAGQAIVYSDRLFHGSHTNTSAQDRVVVTGRVNEKGSQLVYYHRDQDGTVSLIKASPEFYLKEIDALAKGRLPQGYEVLRSFPYAYRPVTEQDLLQKVG